MSSGLINENHWYSRTGQSRSLQYFPRPRLCGKIHRHPPRTASCFLPRQLPPMIAQNPPRVIQHRIRPGIVAAAETVGEHLAIRVHQHEKVFKRYYQVSQGLAREYGGLGVGLTIARIVARALDGDVTILPTEHGCCTQMILAPAPLEMF